jgi:RNA polymerase sigma-70 factor, ECF subfamily
MDLNQEKELVYKARKDPQAFGVLFNEYYPKILGYAAKRTGSVQVGQDIASEVFYKALHNLWQFQWRSIPFSAWLYRIATNEINSYFRKGRYKTLSLDSYTELGFEWASATDIEEELNEQQQQLERRAKFTHIQKLLKELPVAYQEVLALRYFEGKKIEEIAQILGKRTGTVKSLLSRGVGLLRKNFLTSDGTQPFLDTRIVDSEVEIN